MTKTREPYNKRWIGSYTPIPNDTLTPRGTPYPIKIAKSVLSAIVASSHPSFVATVQEGVRRLDPLGVVQASRSTKKALELAQRLPAELLIVPLEDIELNGLEVTSLVGLDRAPSPPKVIVTTDRITTKERRRLEQQGVAAVLIAPANPTDVEQAVQTALHSSAERSKTY